MDICTYTVPNPLKAAKLPYEDFALLVPKETGGGHVASEN